MQEALSGIKVLDITQVMAGPFCGMLLADMGADVIKIEPPAGDETRRWGEEKCGDTPAFNAVNRGKRSVVINLKTSQGLSVARNLSEHSDVLIENYRPGVMKKLGLDYPTLRKANPRLVYASISGYGQTGPKSAKGGFDLVAQGVAGIMSVTGEPGGEPVKAGIPVTDLGAGLFALAGILAAIHARNRNGEGQLVDTSLVDAGVALSIWEATEYFSTGRSPEAVGSAHRTSAPYQAVRCSDGFITVGAANNRLFHRFCGLLGNPDGIGSEEFKTNSGRLSHRNRLLEIIERVTTQKPRGYWLRACEAAGIPCGPINSYDETFSDPQVLSREMVVETKHQTLGRIRTLGTPLKLSGTPLRPGRPSPSLGADTDVVLKESGFSDENIALLRSVGAVG